MQIGSKVEKIGGGLTLVVGMLLGSLLGVSLGSSVLLVVSSSAEIRPGMVRKQFRKEWLAKSAAEQAAADAAGKEGESV